MIKLILCTKNVNILQKNSMIFFSNEPEIYIRQDFEINRIPKRKNIFKEKSNNRYNINPILCNNIFFNS